MQLSPEDVDHFFRLHKPLMFFANQRLKVLGEEVATIEDYAKQPPALRFKVHQAFVMHTELVIDAFVVENPYHFDEPDLEIIRSWRYLVSGTFYAFRQLQSHMIFLSSTEPVLAYGVLSLFSPFEELIGTQLPRMVQTTLLPFKGRIVYDGLINGYNVVFGQGIRGGLNESFKKAKTRYGVLTALPLSDEWPEPLKKKTTPRPKPKAIVAKSTDGRSTTATAASLAHDRIVALTDAFCQEHLNDEYRNLCRKSAGMLARKRPSPLTQGKPESWAAGIVRAVGWVNFLSDPSQPLHMRMSDIDKGFGVSEATGSAKSAAIRKSLKIRRFDHKWMVSSLMEKTPMVWMIQVNGLMMDARRLPREIQEEAFRKGYIPYIPGERAGGPAKE